YEVHPTREAPPCGLVVLTTFGDRASRSFFPLTPILLTHKHFTQSSAERLYQEIVAQGYTGSRRSVRRAVAEIRPKQSRQYKPFETLPGEQAQVDWGHMGRIRAGGVEVPLY